MLKDKSSNRTFMELKRISHDIVNGCLVKF